ncbi:hypothetical protein EXIGLDRAFT_766464 [Exidia glandulosa HHB12029]|uniref:Uncharacterized protein n=1 Tax=Exidia glandulosa HHB12029 TaxID=1314781 RepID=A0A165JQQ6_EXIGL|nr:hypothetical protein EXIGLDRAFT_766464 [Exidia glandulosa HHB12029]
MFRASVSFISEYLHMVPLLVSIGYGGGAGLSCQVSSLLCGAALGHYLVARRYVSSIRQREFAITNLLVAFLLGAVAYHRCKSCMATIHGVRIGSAAMTTVVSKMFFTLYIPRRFGKEQDVLFLFLGCIAAGVMSWIVLYIWSPALVGRLCAPRAV